MSDVIHDPRTDWCACEPNSMDRCGYRLLADAVIEAFNPRDGDEAEAALCMEAIETARSYIESQDCTCTPVSAAGGLACSRCHALGQISAEAVER